VKASGGVNTNILHIQGGKIAWQLLF
jgi:hypothetical protein